MAFFARTVYPPPKKANLTSPTPILFTIPNFITAGSGRVMLNIIERLDRSLFAPAVCVLKKGGSLDMVVEEMGIPFLEAPFLTMIKPYQTLPRRVRPLVQFFRLYQFKLWHSFHYSDDYTEAIIARLAGAKAWIYTKKAMGWGSRAWLLRSYLATRIVADNSEMMPAMFDRVGLRHKVHFIPHGISPEQFSPDQPASCQLRDKFNLDAITPLIGCVAHLVPVKGHPTLIEAMTHVPQGHLIFAGKPIDQMYVQKLESLITQLNLSHRVHFMGGITDVPAFLKEIDVAVLPTWAKWRMEGCPVALIEAMSCAKACVATDIPGSRDLIEHQKSGWLVPPEDVSALADALQALLAQPALRQNLGQAARERVRQHYTIEQEAAAHEAMYAEVLGW